MSMIRVKIDGMTCEGCVKGIQKAIDKHSEVKEYKIDLANGEGVFETSLTVSELVRIIEGQGFDAMEIP